MVGLVKDNLNKRLINKGEKVMELFISELHEERFIHLRRLLALQYQNNKEYLSVIFLLAGDDEFYDKVSPYFDGIEGSFNFPDMFKNEDFSSGYYILAKLAVHLFNNGEQVTPLDLIGSLDANLYNLAMNAIHLRRKGV